MNRNIRLALKPPVTKPLFLSYLFLLLTISNAIDSLTKAQSIRDGETIFSSGETFELGFFSPGNSKNRYIGIWYKKISVTTVVWVANREIPLTDTSGILKVNDSGSLILLNGNNLVIWSSGNSTYVQNPVVQLLESGNLVVRNGDDDSQENLLWQSFDTPGNTYLPGMKFGQDWYFSSWKSKDDPARGNYTYQIDTQGYPNVDSILRDQNNEIYRSPLTGTHSSVPSTLCKFNFVYNKGNPYYSFAVLNSSVLARRVLSEYGVVGCWAWVDERRGWILYEAGPPDDICDRYAICGVNSICNIDHAPPCQCLSDFVPKETKDWAVGDWSKGCIRKNPLDCLMGDEFLKYSGMKFPVARNSFNVNVILEDCYRLCFENCYCLAFSFLNVSGEGSGCLRWFEDMIDMRDLQEDGEDIYVRMASSTSVQVGSNGKSRKKMIFILALTTGMLLLCLCLTFYFCKKKRSKRKKKGIIGYIFEPNKTNKSQKDDMQLPVFDLATIVNATGNFSANNKLGEGGFGTVYKGMLEEGQEIAVKRLSRHSKQGPDEFKNEVTCIAKLQHRNLVKLLGCCIQEDEKMLIYEYMPNKSLDFFIFDQTRGALLDWPKRFHIINGISRGLLYLHQDSRLRIIHRDLKAGNVLLDYDMNPKISDFGLARSFGGNETEANTNRVMGTYGYMSPEYVVGGVFSVKSDVFSYGVMVLEIVSGKRNRDIAHHHHSFSLLGHAWKLYNEGMVLELADAPTMDSSYFSEMLRCIHVALLCVQQFPEDRPSMSSVVMMLGGEGELPQPKPPGFFTERSLLETARSRSRVAPGSINEVSITSLDGR